MENPISGLPITPDRRPLQILAKAFSTPLLIVTGTQEGPQQVSGGTALFWESNKGRYLVTAGHVAEEIMTKGLLNEPLGVCVFTGERALSLRDATVVLNREVDLAVIHLQSLKNVNLVGKQFYQAQGWPPQRVRDGETVGVIGYPGAARKIDGTKITPESIYVERACSLSTSGRWLQLGNADDQMALEKYAESAPYFENLGGISGAPIFALRDGKAEWVGVLSEIIHEKGLASVIRGAHSSYITEDGQIAVA